MTEEGDSTRTKMRPLYEKTQARSAGDESGVLDRPMEVCGHAVPTGKKRVALVGAVGILLVGLLTVLFSGGEPERERTPADEKGHLTEAGAQSPPPGAASSTHHLATQAGLDALRAGGNAVDAAAVMQFMLNVVQPQSTGIGGGCFAVIYNASTGEVSTLDGREEAPDAFHEDAFCADPECQQGPCECAQGRLGETYDDLLGTGYSVGVPGVPRAMDRLLRQRGTFSLAEAVAPAVARARQGFPMYEHLHDKISGAAPRLQHFAASVGLFLKSDKKTPRVAVGETFKNPDLADTLARLGEKGVDDFYDGKLADEIVQAVTSAVNPRTRRGGVMTTEDLRGYRAVWRRPVNTTYRGYQVFSMGPPSGGAVAMVEALNILEGLDLSSMHHNSADYLHAVSEAMNLAWSDRDAYLADPDFTPMPLRYEADDLCESFDAESCPPGCTRLPDGGSLPPKGAVTGELPRRGGCGAAGLLSKAYARARRALMGVHSRKVVKAPIMAGNFSLLQWRDWLPGTHDNSGTTHLSVVDAAGNMVALTTTIENNLGSGVVVPGRGFLLNNELTDFSFDHKTGSGAGYANRPEGGKRLRSSALGDDARTYGGKRPRSSMTPTVVLDAAGKPLLAIGSPGGGRITYTVLGALLSVLDFNMSLRDAINSPRAISRNGPLELETRERCRCDKPIGEDGYVMSVLRARGMPVRFSQGSTTSDYLEAVVVLGNGSFDGYADMKRMPTALGAIT